MFIPLLFAVASRIPTSLRLHDKREFSQSGVVLCYVGTDAQKIVAWMHQRWVWHMSTLKDISHIMFYEDLEVGLV